MLALNHIFDNIEELKPDKTSTCTDINCGAIKRLLTSLKYYTNLNIKINKNNQSIFCNFMDEVYKSQVYDDFHHFIKFHQSQLEEISKLAYDEYDLPTCDLSTCTYSDRHYRVTSVNDTKAVIGIDDTDDTLKYLSIYVETFDGLHFYLFHIFESGMRIQSTPSMNEDQSVEDGNDPYFDAEFSRISKRINSARDATQRFSRLSANKYDIAPDTEETINQNDTYLDTVYAHLLNSKFSVDLVSKLYEAVSQNGHDTESMDIDLEMFENDRRSNLSQEMDDEQLITEMVRFFEASKGIFIYAYFDIFMIL